MARVAIEGASGYSGLELTRLLVRHPSVELVAITAGRLDFGTWEGIFYGEFDRRRRKRVRVKIIGD